MWISTVSSNFARLAALSKVTALASVAGVSLIMRCVVFLITLRSFLPRAGQTPARFFFLPGSGGALGAFGAAGASAFGASPAGVSAAGAFGALGGLAFFGLIG